MHYNYAKLRGRIVEKYGDLAKFSRALGVSTQAVYNTMAGRSGFSQDKILKWAELLDIPQREYLEYFFA